MHNADSEQRRHCSEKARVAILCVVLIATISTGATFSPTSQLNTHNDAEPFQIWKDSFYKSVNYDSDKNLLSFTIPKTVPEGYRFFLHVSGRIFMGEQLSAISFHAFDEESQNYSWVNGKTYTYSLPSNGLDFCLLTYGLIDNNGRETLYDITVLPNGTKSIIKNQ